MKVTFQLGKVIKTITISPKEIGELVDLNNAIPDEKFQGDIRKFLEMILETK